MIKRNVKRHENSFQESLFCAGFDMMLIRWDNKNWIKKKIDLKLLNPDKMILPCYEVDIADISETGLSTLL